MAGTHYDVPAYFVLKGSKMADDISLLKTFIYRNEELDRIEEIADQFNLFASMNIERQEIRHSSFLRWLLDPSETHGLDDYCLKLFLKEAVMESESLHEDSPDLFDLDGWDLSDTIVLKEWKSIDILIRNDSHKYVCVIENKIDSSEHSQQLQRYRDVVETNFKNYKKTFIYLAVTDEVPSDECYLPLNYATIVEIIENTIKRRTTQMSGEIKFFLSQYLEMLRRYVVEDSEVQQLCRRIYTNHRRALDLIFEHRPDRTVEISETIQKYLENREDIILEQSTKSYIRFLTESIDILPKMEDAKWLRSGRVLVWEIENDSNRQRIKLKLELGPGDSALREAVYELARDNPNIFGEVRRMLGKKYHAFYSEVWISGKDYEDFEDDDIINRVESRLDALLKGRNAELANRLRKLDYSL